LDVLPHVDLDESSIRTKVFAERVKIFTDRSVGGAFSSFFGTVLLAWVEAPVVGLNQSLLWFCCINVVEILILSLGYQYRSAGATDDAAPVWARRQIAVAPLLGLAWGSSVWFFWVDGQFLHYILNLLVLVTVTTLTLTIVAPFSSATILFTAGILLPIVAQLPFTNNPFLIQISVGLAILFLVQIRYAALARQQLLTGLDTAVRNAYLAEKLRVSERQMLIAQQLSGTGSWVYDAATGRVFASAEGLRIFGYPAVAGEFPIDDLEACIPERERVRQALSSLITTGQSYDLEYAINPVDGSPPRLVHSIARIERDDRSSKSLVLGFIQDVTQSRKLEDQVRQLAFHDVLTNLPNRRLLLDRLTQTMAVSKRTGRHAALMFLDLDNFKPLNDTHGHEIGDLLLIEVASRLTRCVREIDTVARFGGDEFVVMISELHVNRQESTVQAQIIAEKMRLAISETFEITPVKHNNAPVQKITHHCTVSMGVAVFIDRDGTESDALRWADMAMFEAKNAGRNAIRFHTLGDEKLTQPNAPS
jgi:diguanylate cyclase (GGDEF)-like protein